MLSLYFHLQNHLIDLQRNTKNKLHQTGNHTIFVNNLLYLHNVHNYCLFLKYFGVMKKNVNINKICNFKRRIINRKFLLSRF